MFLYLLGSTLTMAANPLVPNVGQADPHVHVFNDTFYMFATHDFNVNNTGFLMKDWLVNIAFFFRGTVYWAPPFLLCFEGGFGKVPTLFVGRKHP